MPKPTDTKGIAPGIAALSICESLLLALGDLKILEAKVAAGVLHDAADVHCIAGGTGDEAAMHLEVAAIIERIIAGGNSVRHA